MNNSAIKCNNCGKSLSFPAPAELVEEESARCKRLGEIKQQRQALATSMQSGITGMLGSDTMDTVDMVAQRGSLAQLDATLKAEAEELGKVMLHVPDGP